MNFCHLHTEMASLSLWEKAKLHNNLVLHFPIDLKKPSQYGGSKSSSTKYMVNTLFIAVKEQILICIYVM